MSTVVLESLAVLDVTHGAGMRYTPRSALPLVPASPRRWQAGLMPRLKGPTALFRSWKTLPAGRLGSGRVSRQGAVVCKAQDTAVDAPDVTKSTWKTLVLDSKKSVLIEFWAPWCGPCRMILPVIAKLSKTYEDKITCFKINTDESSDFATQYGIRSIPTIIIFKNGKKKDAVIGAVPETTLITCIEKHV